MSGLANKFVKDSTWAFLSQVVSLFSSLIISFILPKFIGVETFGYWQLFMLYTSYVGILHFGFSDGLYIKLGGSDFKKIDYQTYTPQIRLVVLIQVIFAALLFVYSYTYIKGDDQKQLVLYCLSAFILIDNTYKLLSFIFMATGEMIFYSKTVMLEKSIFSIAVLMCLLYIDGSNVKYIIFIYLVCHLIVCCLSIKKYRNFFSHYKCNFLQTCLNIYNNCKIGIVLMASNIMATLIVGSCKFIVERFWDIETFSKISFSLTISTFLLFFISQISYVLFPFLRKVSPTTQGEILTKATFGLTCGSFFAFSLIFPIYGLLYFWLPKYHESLYFLTILAPICIYEIRTNLLYNTFFKNLSKVNELLIINTITILVSLMLYGISVFYNSLDLIALSILITIILRSVIMQLRLYKLYNKHIDSLLIWDLLFTTIVIISFHYGGLKMLLLIYIVFIMLFGTVYRKELYKVVGGIKKILGK